MLARTTHLVGWSTGGAAIASYAVDRPGPVASLTFIDPVSPHGFGGVLPTELQRPTTLPAVVVAPATPTSWRRWTEKDLGRGGESATDELIAERRRQAASE